MLRYCCLRRRVSFLSKGFESVLDTRLFNKVNKVNNCLLVPRAGHIDKVDGIAIRDMVVQGAAAADLMPCTMIIMRTSLLRHPMTFSSNHTIIHLGSQRTMNPINKGIHFTPSPWRQPLPCLEPCDQPHHLIQEIL